MNFHRVRLNLPAIHGQDLPNPKQPVVSIDGLGLEGVVSVYVDSDPQEGHTVVTISLIASVEGEIDTDTNVLAGSGSKGH